MDTESAAARLYKFEGSVPHMYLCTGGKVTIGVGHAIESADEACGLSFDAADDVVSVDYGAVARADPGLVASGYAPLTSSRMGEEDIDLLLYDDIALYEDLVANAVPHFYEYPDPAQEALFDMGYNLGIAGLMKYPRMLAAVDCGDWDTAAAECHRNGIPDDRNQETVALFLSCKS